ncbi:hypothetical protein JOF42_002493 [Microbacterium phyllosphaerae]|uniref:Uncharacterized protein n=1 Tax=Microbacterium phyllosphaerae TaxID=124798 RepID=A0ABS4WSR3_9MICO|nr:hypothetical protein [Microbacterium phyllosphaerae]MBP2378998.1 hypothetical protein [Microbacterium phyllosphaerae]MCS3444331.1 hypothetical protein [Microbacterium phyllosphaerae]
MSDNLSAWLTVLDQFERALDAADEQMEEQPFAPPPGPVPDELRERAEAVLARQQLMINGLVTSRANVAREIAALRRVPTGPGDAPVYLDVQG